MNPDTDTDSLSGGGTSGDDGRDTRPRPSTDRARREAEALRRNLARRKAQQRARRTPDES